MQDDRGRFMQDRTTDGDAGKQEGGHAAEDAVGNARHDARHLGEDAEQQQPARRRNARVPRRAPACLGM